MRQQYVLGFAFDDLSRVALIRRHRPSWQAGFLNGLGGKVEPKDRDPLDAMVREFQEESGVLIDRDLWRPRGKLIGNLGDVHVFTVTTPIVREVRTTSDEEVTLYPWHQIANPPNALPNVAV